MYQGRRSHISIRIRQRSKTRINRRRQPRKFFQYCSKTTKCQFLQLGWTQKGQREKPRAWVCLLHTKRLSIGWLIFIHLLVSDATVTKRTRALSTNTITTADRNKPLERLPAHNFLDSTTSEESTEEESSTSSEDEGPATLDFDNLRRYPKSVLRAFCKSQHIPVEVNYILYFHLISCFC